MGRTTRGLKSCLKFNTMGVIGETTPQGNRWRLTTLKWNSERSTRTWTGLIPAERKSKRFTPVWRTAFHLILLPCLLGFTTADKDFSSPKNFEGARRSFCPEEEHVGNQPVDRRDSSLKLMNLRIEMTRITSVEGPGLDGYIVTSDDEHQTTNFVFDGRDGPFESETVDPRDMRREFLTGFYGSAGVAVVTLKRAALWTDGRYHLQADQQLDCNWLLMKQGQSDVPSIAEWLKYEFRGKDNVRIGADPKLVPAFTWDEWAENLANSSIRLVGVRNNLVDLIWQVDRPNYNPHGAYPLRSEYSGTGWQEKVRQVREEMSKVNADALVITALDEIAWLFNIRGYDLPHTPVVRAYATLTHGEINIYAPRQKLLRSVDTHLKMDSCYHADCVKWHNYTSIWYDLRTMSQTWNRVWLPSLCVYSRGASKQIYSSVPAEKRLAKPSPIIALRAVKNEIESQGMRRSHVRDAVAMCDFLSYMEEQIGLDSTGWDELQVARVANEFRLEQDLSTGISFPTIAAYGPHGALPHYEPTNLTNVKVGMSSTLVVDSGGQYLDGTTDVTRTLHYGQPTQEQIEAYTRVLIGSIQLSSLIFSSDLRTDQLDVIAREPLWKAGHDYMHGTGHGIGHFLSVHESPISVSYAGSSCTECNSVQLKPGFFLSNEPGFYREGDFGVRLENILEVIPADESSGWQKFLKFRDITLVPYEPKLIDYDMLTTEHKRWLNEYNQRIRDKIGVELQRQLRMKAFDWMMEKTQSIPVSAKESQEILLLHSGTSPSTSVNFHLLLVITLLWRVY